MLTGGGANLKHLAAYAKEKLRLPVRIAKPGGFSGMSDKATGPEFAAALGLMLADFESTPMAAQTKKNIARGAKSSDSAASFGKLFKQAGDLFKKFKP